MEILPTGEEEGGRVEPRFGESQTGGEAFRTTRKDEQRPTFLAPEAVGEDAKPWTRSTNADRLARSTEVDR
jgi:hypothetical protein